MSGSLTYEEFEFFNNQFSLITEEEYNIIKSKLKQQANSYFCNEYLLDKKLFLVFDKHMVEYKNIYGTITDLSKINNAIYYYNYIFFNYNIDNSIVIYREIMDKFKRDTGYKYIYINNEEEFTKLIYENFINDEVEMYGNSDEFRIALAFFGFKQPEELPEINTDESAYVKAGVVSDVVESRINDKNYRLVLFFYSSGYSNYKYIFKLVEEEDNLYNYLDINRIFINKNYDGLANYYRLPLECNEFLDGKLVFKKRLYSVLRKNVSGSLKSGSLLITPQIYKFYKDRYDFYSTAEHTTLLDIKQEKIMLRYVAILKEGREIKINNIVMSKNMIKYNDENFKIEFDENFLDLTKTNTFNTVRNFLKDDEVKYNFNTFFNKLLKLSKLGAIEPHSGFKLVEKVEFIVNNMLISIEQKGNRYYLNNIVVRIYDVLHILSNVLCYNKIEEFNKYIKGISFIGIKYARMLNTGINIEFNYDEHLFNGIMPVMRLTLCWDTEKRRNIYLSMNKIKYRIKSKVKFVNFFNGPKKYLTMSKLKQIFIDTLDGFETGNYQELLLASIEEGKIVKKRGMLLVEETLKDTGSVLTTIKVRDIEFKGYKLTGSITNAEYFIKCEDLDVYKLKNGTWNKRCVLDRADKQRIYEDRLANRIVNIYNEPEFIYTIGGRNLE